MFLSIHVEASGTSNPACEIIIAPLESNPPSIIFDKLAQRQFSKQPPTFVLISLTEQGKALMMANPHVTSNPTIREPCLAMVHISEFPSLVSPLSDSGPGPKSRGMACCYLLPFRVGSAQINRMASLRNLGSIIDRCNPEPETGRDAET